MREHADAQDGARAVARAVILEKHPIQTQKGPNTNIPNARPSMSYVGQCRTVFGAGM